MICHFWHGFCNNYLVVFAVRWWLHFLRECGNIDHRGDLIWKRRFSENTQNSLPVLARTCSVGRPCACSQTWKTMNLISWRRSVPISTPCCMRNPFAGIPRNCSALTTTRRGMKKAACNGVRFMKYRIVNGNILKADPEKLSAAYPDSR